MSIWSLSGIGARHLETSTEQGSRAVAHIPPERPPCPFSFEMFVNSRLCEDVSFLWRSTRGEILIVRSVGNCLRAVSWNLYAGLLEGDGALTLSTPGAGRKGHGCVLGLPGGCEDRSPGAPGHPSGGCSARATSLPGIFSKELYLLETPALTGLQGLGGDTEQQYEDVTKL